MNYITYKQIDGTITSGFKVKLYDIVTLNTGYWKDKLAIVLYINEDKKQIKVRIIECGMNLTLKVKDVQFVNHNNRTLLVLILIYVINYLKPFVINILINSI